MAVYKVAQDVEADDKLIGPFSFRQFIYLVIVAISIALAWGLFQIFPALVILPLPLVIFFGALALPIKKDQPMETYLAAIISFYVKPRKRIWQPDGIESMVEITTPKTVEVQRTKDITQSEAEQRLSYLAQIADTEGWAIRHSAVPSNTRMQSDIYYSAQQTEDILDDTGGVAQNFNSMIEKADDARHEAMLEKMRAAAAGQPPLNPEPAPELAPTYPDPYASLNQTPFAAPQSEYNPYPAMQQQVVQPLPPEPQPQAIAPAEATTSTQAAVPPGAAINTPNTENTPTTSEIPVSPDIINLANSDLSVATIAHEAERLKKQASDDGEVLISLR